MTLPPGYEAVPAQGAWGFALLDAAPWAREVLADPGTLYAWAGGHPQASAMAGRGQVYSVPAPVAGPDGHARWVVRHYFRGGAVARWLDDRYLAVGEPRPLLEARVSSTARARHIPTPAVVAGAVYGDGVFYRADLVTELIPESSDLAEVLFGENPLGLGAEGALTAAGRLVRSLERTGVLHRDLNAKNIVLQRTPDGPRAHLVDLDRCGARQVGVPAPTLPMRRRLERSLRKFEGRMGHYLPHGAWSALHKGFGDA
ncbi:MAG TPA: lipopolysaccharide kinase InaA family protein [Longimicrobiales bacterium]|nr:lipopolysaccharide kinase InaA family protein [Longimicrobiales bacterium]